MRPVIAKRLTSCDYCKEPIEPRSDRLDDVIKTPKFYKRIHYHPKCFTIKIDAWYEKHRNDVTVYVHSGGHPDSGLSLEERTLRDKTLVKLANVVKYYSGRLNLGRPVDELTTDELRQFNNFSLRFRECAEILAPIGGLPKRYMDISAPSDVIQQIEASQVSVAVSQS